MPTIKCKQCDAYISDPCIKMSGLFLSKMDLQTQSTENNGKIAAIDSILRDDLGLYNHHQLFQSFQRNMSVSRSPSVDQPVLFTLRCINGHTNQYLLTCP